MSCPTCGCDNECYKFDPFGDYWIENESKEETKKRWLKYHQEKIKNNNKDNMNEEQK